MKHRKGSYRLDVSDEVRKIEADLVENIRALGFQTFAQTKKENEEIGENQVSRMTPSEQTLSGALFNISDAIDFVQHFDRQVAAMLAGARKLNKNAPLVRYAAKITAGESESRTAKAA